jgi:SAM-dependent methyltransferase
LRYCYSSTAVHYLLKAALQNAVALLPRPLGQPLYYQLQRRFGALRQVDYQRHLEKAAKIADILHQQNLPLERRFLEVGTGWVLGTPLGLWLAGAAEIVTVDLHRYLKEELVLGLLRYIGEHAAELPALFPWVPRAELMRKAQVVADCRSLAELWLAVPIRYAAPADATHLPGVSAASIDYHYSTNVLEHVPAVTLAGLLAEARRVLRPGGHLVHLVDLSDHFGHDDPRRMAVHFLRHGPLAWRLLAGNRFMYQNRLRLPQYRALLAAAGLPIVWERAVADAPSLAMLQASRPPVHPQFLSFSAEELAAVYWEVLAVSQ